ncbi:ribosome biogenesis protein ytm1 [Arthrobotrys musiformis]|uniref:Ribosome biogenesis protein YTM1 n=1 Tax=Arthrobotrys musiformis TaxID=47236 RepID=A0AAV9VXX0_9PEZI
MADTMDIDQPSSSPRIQINLSTRDTTLSIPLQPLRVPTNLKRYGLSTLVNHLLETPNPIPFDFLVDGKYLRTSIDEYLTQAGLSSEKPLDVEYVRSQLPPTYVGSFEQDDWIASVNISPSSFSSPVLLTGSYNGTAQITSLSGDVIAKTVPMHTQSVKTTTWVSGETPSFLTAGLDRAINLWSYTPPSDPSSQTLEIQPTTSFISHKSTITSLTYSSSTSQFLSSSADHTIALWSTDTSSLPTITAPQSTAFTRKRRRTKAPTTIKKGPLAVLTPHTAPVSQVIIHPTDQTVAYSVSWDKSIITHDLITSLAVSTRTTQHPLFSITALPSVNLLAAGSAARHITLHDPRESSKTVQTAVLRGHTNGVVSLVGSPESEYVLASGSHDGTVRIWDVRSVSSSSSDNDGGEGKSGGSLFVIKRESGTGKVFGVDWSREVGLVSVGEDKKIQVNKGEGMADVTVMDQT